MADDLPDAPWAAPQGGGSDLPDAPWASQPATPSDHGLAERQKLSPIGKALSPITGYWPTYEEMNREAREQAATGYGQLTRPKSAWDVARGAGNIAMGGLGYVASPINAAYRSVIGQPVEDVTGIPREYTEFAAQLATPGLGMTRMPRAPGAVAEAAPKTVPSVTPQELQAGRLSEEFNIPYSLGQTTGDLDRIRYEDMAARGAYGPEAQQKAAKFFEDQFAALQQAGRNVGQQFGHGEQPLGTPADAAAALNTEVAGRAATAREMRDAVVARAEQEAAAQRQMAADRQRAIDEAIGQGRPPVEPREAGEVVGQRVREQAQAGREAYRRSYEEAYSTPGEISAKAFEGLGNRIKNELTFGDTPVVVDDQTPIAHRTLNRLNSVEDLRIPNYADPRRRPMTSAEADAYHAAHPNEPRPPEIAGINMQGLDRARRMLQSDYRRTLPGSEDRRAVSAIISAFDNQVERAMAEGLFSGDPRALEALQRARAQFRQYRQTFHPQGAGDDVGLAMRRIVERNATPEEISNMIIGSGRLGGTGLPVRIADRLENVLGQDSAAWTDIRQAMWQKASQVRNSAGEIDAAKSANNIFDFANSTLGRRMFSPDELSAMRSHAQAVRDLDRTIETLPSTQMAERAKSIYQEAFGGEELAGSQRAVFQRMVSGTATPQEVAQTMFSAIGGGNSGNAVRALRSVERIVGRDSPAMGAIRQGVWQKLTQNPFGKDPQGQQKLAQGINEFLNGKGQDIARQLYTHEERALMQRYADAVKQTVIPRLARTNSDTAPATMAIMRKLGTSLGRMVGMGGHGGLTRYAVGALLDKAAEKAGAIREAKRLNESFGGGPPPAYPNPLAPGRSRPTMLPPTVATSPYALSGTNSYNQ